MPTPYHPRATRTRPWVAISAALAVMSLLFVILVVVQMTGQATHAAPVIVLMDAHGTTGMQQVKLTADQVEHKGTDQLTVRFRNSSPNPAHVALILTGGPSSVSATLTAALTGQGAVVRSGNLAKLTIADFTLDAGSTTPVTLELDAPAGDLAAMWSSTKSLTLTAQAS